MFPGALPGAGVAAPPVAQVVQSVRQLTSGSSCSVAGRGRAVDLHDRVIFRDPGLVVEDSGRQKVGVARPEGQCLLYPLDHEVDFPRKDIVELKVVLMTVHAGRALRGVYLRIDPDDLSVEVSPGCLCEAEIGIQRGAAEARPERAIVRIGERGLLPVPARQTLSAHT